MPLIDGTSANGGYLALIVVTTALFGYAGLGALRVCLERYPPRWPGVPQPAGYVRRGRRAWALCWMFATMAALGLYRGWWLWTHPAFPSPAAGTWIEAFRLAGGLYLVWAFRPGSGAD